MLRRARVRSLASHHSSTSRSAALLAVGNVRRGRMQLFPAAAGVCLALTLLAGTGQAQLDFEKAPILYSTQTATTPVTQLQQQLAAGEVQLEFDEQHGWLPSLLEQLKISPASQVLVFSKTSLQLRRITRRRPRALYFNDDVYIGRVQNSDLIELMSLDPQLGAVFHTLEPGEDGEPPRITRDRGQCLICHASSRTQGVPGGLVRSVFVNSGGQPLFGAGTFSTDHTSPFKERWGGWYVTGTHGSMRHMGNVYSASRLRPEEIDREDGANVTDLTGRLNVEPYLTPHSDIVALMVLEHQTLVQNRMTRAAYEARQAAHYDTTMNAALKRPADHVSDSTRRRIASASDKLVQALLFCDEFTLTSPVAGSTTFAAEFTARGPQDRQGRSLRAFDLKRRMFRYPCSWLIGSKSFQALPATVHREVAQQFRAVLLEASEDPRFAHLTATDRQAIAEILTETTPEFWKLVESATGGATSSEQEE